MLAFYFVKPKAPMISFGWDKFSFNLNHRGLRTTVIDFYLGSSPALDLTNKKVG